MSIYHKTPASKIWWYKFQFQGTQIRESTGTRDRTLAGQIERKRRRELEEGAAGIARKAPPPMFDTAVKQWMDYKTDEWEPATRDIHTASLKHLTPAFRGKLLSDITREDWKRYQRDRQEAGASRKTVNLECETLRAVLIYFRQWDRLKGETGKQSVKMLRLDEEDEPGLCLTSHQQSALEEACCMSRSRILYVMVVVALETAARVNTIRLLRWRNVNLAERCVKWGKDKTPAGSGRIVPLNRRALAVLQFWGDQFPDRRPDDFVFPSEQYGAAGHKFGKEGHAHNTVLHSVDPTKPIGTIQASWKTAKRLAGWILAGKPTSQAAPLECRFHDLRHTAITRMLMNGVPINTVAKVVGWSPTTMVKMAKRYSHLHVDDLRGAMEAATDKNGAQNGAHPIGQQTVILSQEEQRRPT